MRYNKPPLTLPEQIKQLKARGMSFADEQAAQRTLARLNYYRLTAYWYPFFTDHPARTFKAGTRFEDILTHYEFDRSLRLHVLDAIARFEVALRTQFAYQLAHRHDPWAYENATLLSDTAQHTGRLGSLNRELRRSREIFILHYKRKYNNPERPPIWIACEVMSFGLLSGLFDSLKRRVDRQAIAGEFQLDERGLRSLAHHLTTVRNTCAHHGRLWNRRFTVTTKLPKVADKALTKTLEASQSGKLYNTLALLAFCLLGISDDNRWRGQLIELINQYPIIDTAAMGFPHNWQQRPLWRTAGKKTS